MMHLVQGWPTLDVSTAAMALEKYFIKFADFMFFCNHHHFLFQKKMIHQVVHHLEQLQPPLTSGNRYSKIH